jgi:hypothetical protein
VRRFSEYVCNRRERRSVYLRKRKEKEELLWVGGWIELKSVSAGGSVKNHHTIGGDANRSLLLLLQQRAF